MPDPFTLLSAAVTASCENDWPRNGSVNAPEGGAYTVEAGAYSEELALQNYSTWSVAQLDLAAKVISAGNDPIPLLVGGDVAGLEAMFHISSEMAQALVEDYAELQASIDAQAQAEALSHLNCLWWSTETSASCDEQAVVDGLNPFIVPARAYSSSFSQADADVQAQAAANNGLRCRWVNSELTRTCADVVESVIGLAPDGTPFPPGTEEGLLAVTSVTITAGTHESYLSYADAMAIAEADALRQLVCFYISTEQVVSCAAGFVVDPVTYGNGLRGNPVTVPAGAAGSFGDLADANDLAESLGLQYLDCYYSSTYTAYCQPKPDKRRYRIDGSLNTCSNNVGPNSAGSCLGLTLAQAEDSEDFTVNTGACVACAPGQPDSEDNAIRFLLGQTTPPAYPVGVDEYGQIARFRHAGFVADAGEACCNDPGVAIPYAFATAKSYSSQADADELAKVIAAGKLICTHTNWDRKFDYCGDKGSLTQDRLLKWRGVLADLMGGDSTEEANVAAEELAIASRVCLPWAPWRIWWSYTLSGGVDINLIVGSVKGVGVELKCLGKLFNSLMDFYLNDCTTPINIDPLTGAVALIQNASPGFYRVWYEIKCCSPAGFPKAVVVIMIAAEGGGLAASSGVTYNEADVTTPGFYPIEAEERFKEDNNGSGAYLYVGHVKVE